MSAVPAGEASPGNVFAERFVRFAFALGLVLSAVLLWRTLPGGDQVRLLARGWMLAERGELVPYGNPLSGGGFGPGPATSIVVGLPLFVWQDPRAPAVGIWLLHLAAWFLFDRRLRRILTPGERAAFALVYWLNPWRVAGAAVLWNPHYLFLLGAAHFATAYDQREKASFWSSFVHVASLGVALQLHPSTLLLIAISGVLFLTRTIRVSWAGVACGIATSIAALLPWLLAVKERPELLHAANRVLFRSLALVQPWLKGLHYWIRYPSFSIPKEYRIFDFTALVGAEVDRFLAPALSALVLVAGLATMVVAVAANVELFRERRPGGLLRRGPGVDGREFLLRYVVAGAIAAIVVFAASPTTPQSWQGLVLFHVTVLPVVFWLGRRLDREPSSGAVTGRVRKSMFAAVAVGTVLALATGYGAPNFRCGGRGDLRYELLDDSPMYHDLGIHAACPWPVGIAGGAWPDGLPRMSQGSTMEVE